MSAFWRTDEVVEFAVFAARKARQKTGLHPPQKSQAKGLLFSFVCHIISLHMLIDTLQGAK